MSVHLGCDLRAPALSLLYTHTDTTNVIFVFSVHHLSFFYLPCVSSKHLRRPIFTKKPILFDVVLLDSFLAVVVVSSKCNVFVFFAIFLFFEIGIHSIISMVRTNNEK